MTIAYTNDLDPAVEAYLFEELARQIALAQIADYMSPSVSRRYLFGNRLDEEGAAGAAFVITRVLA